MTDRIVNKGQAWCSPFSYSTTYSTTYCEFVLLLLITLIPPPPHYKADIFKKCPPKTYLLLPESLIQIHFNQYTGCCQCQLLGKVLIQKHVYSSLPRHADRDCKHCWGNCLNKTGFNFDMLFNVNLFPPAFLFFKQHDFSCVIFLIRLPFSGAFYQKFSAQNESCNVSYESTNYTGGVLEALCVWEENWQFVSHIRAILPLLVQTHYKLQVQ